MAASGSGAAARSWWQPEATATTANARPGSIAEDSNDLVGENLADAGKMPVRFDSNVCADVIEISYRSQVTRSEASGLSVDKPDDALVPDTSPEQPDDAPVSSSPAAPTSSTSLASLERPDDAPVSLASAASTSSTSRPASPGSAHGWESGTDLFKGSFPGSFQLWQSAWESLASVRDRHSMHAAEKISPAVTADDPQSWLQGTSPPANSVVPLEPGGQHAERFARREADPAVLPSRATNHARVDALQRVPLFTGEAVPAAAPPRAANDARMHRFLTKWEEEKKLRTPFPFATHSLLPATALRSTVTPI